MIINGRPRNGSTTRGEKGALDFQISLEHDINTTIKYLANKKILREVVNNKNSPFQGICPLSSDPPSHSFWGKNRKKISFFLTFLSNLHSIFLRPAFVSPLSIQNLNKLFYCLHHDIMSILLFIFLVTLKKGSSSSSYIGKLYIMYVVLFIGFRNIKYKLVL